MGEGASYTWGTEPEERLQSFPCDSLIAGCDDAYFRGVTIRAQADVVFRWLCQMRAAPYSYDWIDNFGRRSPRVLTPGLDKLAVGQRVMAIFELACFVNNEHLTLRTPQGSFVSRIMGEAAASYVVVPVTGGTCRLLVKLLVRFPKGVAGGLMRRVLPWADLIMMRRQLFNFRTLAESMEK